MHDNFRPQSCGTSCSIALSTSSIRFSSSSPSSLFYPWPRRCSELLRSFLIKTTFRYSDFQISQGIQYTVKLYPNSYLVQILVGVARGAGGGIVKIVEQVGFYMPDFRILKISYILYPLISS